jgi:hypothetical protein
VLTGPDRRVKSALPILICRCPAVGSKVNIQIRPPWKSNQATEGRNRPVPSTSRSWRKLGAERTTPPERNMIARRRWLGAEPSKSPGLILSAQISASLNSGKIRPVKYGATLADHGGREASPGRRLDGGRITEERQLRRPTTDAAPMDQAGALPNFQSPITAEDVAVIREPTPTGPVGRLNSGHSSSHTAFLKLISGGRPAVIDYSRTSRGHSRIVRPKMALATPRLGRFFDTRGEAAN